MKITDIKTFAMDAVRVNWIFVKVYTDEGVTGVGEATLEYKGAAVVSAIEDLKNYLVGKDPMDIELHVYRMYRDSYWRTGPILCTAISGIEIALWDIAGKFLGVPVYRLLGGMIRDRIPIYANGWFRGAKTNDDFVARVQEAREKGFKAYKWDPFGTAYLTITNEELANAIDCVARVREAVGPTVDLLIEAHGRFNVGTAITVARELAPFKIKFL
jgi:galactonate dehydratase